MTASEWVTMAGLITNMVGSFYGVSPTAEATFASAAQRIYSRTSTSWDGCWTVAVLDPEDEQRLALREELGWLGLGALTPNVLSSPTVGTRPVAELVERLGSTLLALTRGPLEHGATLGDNALAVLVTPLHELHAAYLEHLDRFVPVLESIETEPDPADAFIVRTLLIDSWRRIVLRDVDLPEALLPPDWLGGRGLRQREICTELWLPRASAISTPSSGPRMPDPPRIASPTDETVLSGGSRLVASGMQLKAMRHYDRHNTTSEGAMSKRSSGAQVALDPRSLPAESWDNPPVRRHELDGGRYASTDFFRREWEGMWTKVWLLLGRENAMVDPGSYQVEEVGPESIIMVRQGDGAIRAFYNVCQHRGSRLMFAAAGDTSEFVCPYHGWTYGIDGTLTAAKDPEDFPQNPCDHLRLVEVACETFAGFVWVNMDSECEPLRDFLGPLCDEWERYEAETWQRVTALSVTVPCNWKVLQDNFCESYHLPTVHPQLKESHEDGYLDTTFDMSSHGHNRMIMKGATPSSAQYGDNPPLPAGVAERLDLWGLDSADFEDRPLEARHALQRQMRVRGPERGHEHYENLRDEQFTDAHHYNLFPNCSLTFGADGVLLQRMRPHATDPTVCVFDHWYYAFVLAGTGIVGSQTNVRVDGLEAEHQIFHYGDRPMGIIPDQDVAITAGQQLGVRSRGYSGAYLSGQEERISWFHQVIDEYIAGDRPHRS